MDSTIKQCEKLLETLLSKDFCFSKLRSFYELYRGATNEDERIVALRQDVDRLPINSLIFVRLHHDMGVKSTVFFRIVKESFDAKMNEEIAKLDHEIGNHYEDLSLEALSVEQ